MLAEIQTEFARALYAENPGGPELSAAAKRLLALPRLGAEESLGVYRASVGQVLEDALGEIFPVCAELVGEACFRSVAALYLRAVPSRHADLARVGDAWPDFAEGQAILSGVPYLADVGRLELGLHQAHAAPWPDPVDDPAALGEAMARDPDVWRLLLAPSASLFASEYPVLTLWEAHQDRRVDRGWTLDPAAPGERVIVCRQGSEIYADLVEPGLWPILASIAAGEAVARQLALAEGLRGTAEAVNPGDRVPILTTLQVLFERGWVVGGLRL